MLSSIKYRGPDSSGSYLDETTALGIQRLSIIDLKTGNQPIYNEDRSLVIVFNGEIYNYVELREKLLHLGHRFKTKSDTEVIVHLYEEYREDMPKHLNGMFAVAVWDRKNKTLFLARDHAGIKPLYYHFDGKTLIFGSEIKTLLANEKIKRAIDNTSLDIYSVLGYVPGERTIFQNIFRLNAGSYIKFSTKGLEKNKYWHVAPKDGHSLKELDKIFDNAVKKQLVADVPVGVFLSGGLDSSLVTYYASKYKRNLNSFSLIFENPGFDEGPYARQVARQFGTKHHEEVYFSRYVLEDFPKISRLMDEPLANISIFLTYRVCQLARKYVTVSLSGDGGDELFGGYQTYKQSLVSQILEIVPKSFLPAIIDLERLYPLRSPYYQRSPEFIHFFESLRYPQLVRHLYLSTCIDSSKTYPVLSKAKDQFWFRNLLRDFPPCHLSFSQQRQYFDFSTHLRDNLLTVADRASMFNSLEVRVPFLDPSMINFAFGSTIQHAGMRSTKKLLRKLAERKLPQEIISRPKRGFSMPKSGWIRSDLNPLVRENLNNRRLYNYFDKREVDRALREHMDKVQNHANYLWMLTTFSAWLQNWLL